MTIIVFLIDTSASMNQRTFIGARPTMLDIAKGAVETFVKLRQRSPESRGDRYMLFTFEEPPMHIKAGWKENLATFMNELKNIKATGLSTLGPAIKNVFDVLNINRMQSGIDTYGTGRSPFFLEPSVIIIITDGGKLSSQQGVQDDIFPLPKVNPIPGAELTKEIFRWDQRLFGLVLRLTGTPAPDPMGLVPSDNSPLDKLCEQTGGRSYAVRSHRMFQQCIDSLVQKVQSGVVINFEKIGPDPPPINPDGKETPDVIEVDKENQQNNVETNGGNGGLGGGGLGGGGMLGHMLQNGGRPHTPNSMPLPLPNPPSNAWHNCRKMIYVPRPAQRGSPSGFWPIPESFWPDTNTLSLPARSAHPNVKFTCTSQEPMVIDNLPFDKYELEPSPLTQFILSRKQPTVCWQVYIPNSSKNSDVGHPFGYLKASTTLQTVNLFVMPYNYPVLLPLLDDLFKTHRLKATKEWRIQFDNYLRTMPPYYANPLKRALGRMGAPNLVPDNLDNSLSFQVTNQLKRLKNQAKLEYERICLEVEKRLSQTNCVVHEGIRVQPRRPLCKHLTSNHTLQDKLAPLRDQVTDYPNFVLAVREGEVNPQMYRNPFDIPRSCLLDQLTRMRANFLQSSLTLLLTDRDRDQLHCRPISQMGNYQDYLKKMTPPLREIESTPVRQHMFGNPFKIDKRPAESQSTVGRPNKRKRGPLPLDFTIQRINKSPSQSPSSSPNTSPCPSPSPSLSPSPTTPITSPGVPPSPPDSPAAQRVEERADIRQEISRPERPDTPPVFQPTNHSATPMPGYSPGRLSVSPPGSPAALSPPEERTNTLPIDIHPMLNGDVTPPPPSVRDEEVNQSVSEAFEMDYDILPPAPSRTPPPEIIYDDGVEKNGIVNNSESRRATSTPITPADTQATKTYNKELKMACFKLVKKPGRDFRQLFDQLNTVQGSYESRLKMVNDVVHEASRFKRHSLVKLLSQFLDSMMNTEKGTNTRPSVRVNGHSR
ncbi:Integrator complex subunit 6-A-like [Homarus americanus]|uniref:Integrator complex subunit 6-A-like n=1 Tax=Homarus americanus TaxID=6706 RepID=A0A8J5TK61_HOMAM|nr:Integrator complex subunit 6-A-like [Homarus americanus]